MRGLLTGITVLMLASGFPATTAGRSATDYADKGNDTRLSAGAPYHCVAAHRVGNISLAVNNNGTIGSGFSVASLDCFTGDPVPSCEFPKWSATTYLFAGALWVGAVVGDDTLVSVGADGWVALWEMFPDDQNNVLAVKRSILNGDSGAISEEDYIFAYADTLTDGVGRDYSGRSHIPLPIEITQSSYAWSYAYAEDFVLIIYEIENMGAQPLNDAYIGLYVDGDAFGDASLGFKDDVAGFIGSLTVPYGSCQFQDTFNLAWIADNDGDLSHLVPVPNVTGARTLGGIADAANLSFNWWLSNGNSVLDFGPRERANVGQWQEPFMDFGTGGTGTPMGDRNKYYIMRNQETDYDQAYTGVIPPDDPLWLPCATGAITPTVCDDFANGYDTRYLLSLGPFDISPGQVLSFPIAYVGGQYFHTDPNNFQHLPEDPDQYYAGLNFADLAFNARWAQWIYDHPGVDTDSDGYAGKFHVCCDGPNCDTIWYTGDGVPDLQGAPPPPAPQFWLEPRESAIHVRWNGLLSETAEDNFSRKEDFEGYNVYLSTDAARSGFSLVASYDIEDYFKYTFNFSQSHWELRDDPFTLEELRCLYGAAPDPCNDVSFHPDLYPESNPYFHPLFFDSVFYFAQVAQNLILGVTTPIQKRFPGAPYPSSLDPLQAEPDELTDDGFLKYFEYELLIENLLPDREYLVNVTAFDFGSAFAAVPSQESSVWDGAQPLFLPPLPPLPVALDIMPRTCPNLITRKDETTRGDPTPLTDISPLPVDRDPEPLPFPYTGGILLAAVLGSIDFDVAELDPTTLQLGGYSALNWDVADVAAPLEGVMTKCQCTDAGPDRSPDLILKFPLDSIRESVNDWHDGNVVRLTLTGETRRGRAIVGADCVTIRAPGSGDSRDAGGTVILKGNFPNPFNPSTDISFVLASPAEVTLDVYNAIGQKVATLINGPLEAGEQTIRWNATGLASGVYFYRIEANEQVVTRKMLLLK